MDWRVYVTTLYSINDVIRWCDDVVVMT